MSEEGRNEPSFERSLLNYRLADKLWSNVILPFGLRSLSHKPLKGEDEIRRYLNINKNIPRNLRDAYPELEDMMRLRSIDAALIERFIKEITEDRISNLVLARYIEHKKPDLYFNIDPSFGLNANLSYLNKNISPIFNVIKGDLTKRKILSEKDEFTPEVVAQILNQHINDNAWLEGSDYEGHPSRRRAQILLTYPEILLLIILVELANNPAIEFNSYGDFGNEVEDRINKFRESDIPFKERVKTLAGSIRNENILVKPENSNKYRVRQLNWSPLFLESEGALKTPKHIASFPDKNSGTFHHAVYFSNDIVIEQLSGKTPTGYDLFVSMKTIYDFLKWSRTMKSKIFIIPYTNPYPAKVLRKRTLWTLGKFPFYSAANENCESVPSWIFENNVGKPGICIPNLISPAVWPGRGLFFSQFMNRTYNPITSPIRGGKTRRYRKGLKQTRRSKHY
jgi:hypothetical protein